MPSLCVFGRRWAIGSDDFVFPNIAEGILRFFWFAVAFGLYFFPTEYHCPDGQHLATYILMLLVLNATLIALCFLTAYVSAQGTILDSYPRRHLSLIIYLRVPLFLTEIGINVYGTVAVAQPLSDCTSYVIHSVAATVVLEWLVVIIFVLGLFLVFDPLGAVHSSEYSLARERAKRVWRRRLRVLCVCANPDDNAKAAFEDVADLLTDVFHMHELDLVPTDVWAGLLMLANQEYTVLKSRPIEPLHSLPGLAESGPVPEWMNVQYASRMVQFALAIYGWPYYVWNNCGLEPWAALVNSVRCCDRCRCDQVLVRRDNCCRCNTAAFLLTTNIRDAELFYVSFHNQIFEVPFVACADVSTRTIVIAIRGSMSLRDVVTDLAALPASLPLSTGGQQSDVVSEQPSSTPLSTDSLDGGVRVHRGMMRVAHHVLAELDKHHVLDDMFVLYPDYNLTITGHSLGAGVAALVGMFLRRRYPNVRVVSFSPPGCVVNQAGVALTESFVCSCVVGDDLVPRMSFESMTELRQDIVDVIERCELAKYEILLKGCFKLLCGPQRPLHTQIGWVEDAADDEAYLVNQSGSPAVVSSIGAGGSGETADLGDGSNSGSQTGPGGQVMVRVVSRRSRPLPSLSDGAVETPPPDPVVGPSMPPGRSSGAAPLLGRQRSLAGQHSYGTDGMLETVGNPALMSPTSSGLPAAGGQAPRQGAVPPWIVLEDDEDASARSQATQRVSLHCPGRVMHVMPRRQQPMGSEPVWHPPPTTALHTNWSDYKKFTHIKMSSRMVLDHMPYYVADVLAEAARQEADLPSEVIVDD